MKILHFADAHIDMANTGRQDPNTGLPIRVMDYLRSLDEIIDAAIHEKVDMVLFAGDAYKDRNPAPTFMREWGRRMIKLSKAKIPTLLLVGNHDLSPSLGRAHALEEYATLEVPYIKVLDKPQFLGPADLWDLPLQVIALPWVTRSAMLAALQSVGDEVEDIYTQMEEYLTLRVNEYLDAADHSLPIVLAAHASVQGAVYGGEHTVMLGNDLVLSGSLVRDKRLDYVALGHIHKKQNLNEGGQPPVVYPGSIERIDFGEARDDKFFVIADVHKANTQLDWRQLRNIRKFWTGSVTPENELNITAEIIAALPPAAEMQDAIVRLVVYYPREWEPFIDEARIRAAAAGAFEFHLIKRPQVGLRSRIAEGRVVSEMTPYDLLDIYWDTIQLSDEDARGTLTQLARDIIETPLQDEE